MADGSGHSGKKENTDTGGASLEDGSFVVGHWRKLAALVFWLSLFAGYQFFAWRSGLGPVPAVEALVQSMSSGPLGAFVFVAVYAARPLILFPASLLTIAAGLVFGPVTGVVLSVIGSNTSATVAYFVGRYFGGEVPASDGGFVRRYSGRLRRNAFETVFLTRLIYIPYDLVNYVSGLLRVGWTPFIMATAIGSLPGTLSFVLLGASLGPDALSGDPQFDPRVLAASVVLLVVGFAFSRYLKAREVSTSRQNGR